MKNNLLLVDTSFLVHSQYFSLRSENSYVSQMGPAILAEEILKKMLDCIESIRFKIDYNSPVKVICCLDQSIEGNYWKSFVYDTESTVFKQSSYQLGYKGKRDHGSEITEAKPIVERLLSKHFLCSGLDYLEADDLNAFYGLKLAPEYNIHILANDSDQYPLHFDERIKATFWGSREKIEMPPFNTLLGQICFTSLKYSHEKGEWSNSRKDNLKSAFKRIGIKKMLTKIPNFFEFKNAKDLREEIEKHFIIEGEKANFSPSQYLENELFCTPNHPAFLNHYGNVLEAELLRVKNLLSL